jgi:ssDNA-binding Zn-finger/Zn-ribbon topoisomerase 1
MEEAGENIACPKCLTENRKGVLTTIKSAKGSFLVCTLGREKCGYLSNIARTSKQQKGLLESKCPNCSGVMKLYLPKQKDKSPALFCIKEGCKGVLWFNDKGGLNSPTASSSNANITTNNGNARGIQETGAPCIKCGKPTVKRSFKKKDGNQGQFWGCSGYRNGCDAPPNWIN